MAISARKRIQRSNPAFLVSLWAIGALAAVCAALATSCGGDDEPFTSVVLAIRTDGGSPVLSAFAGDLESNPVELPPGTYYVKAVNENADTFPFNEMEIGPGESFSVAPFSASFSSSDMAHAVRVMADFVFELEMARLSTLESMSGGYTTPLFDEDGEPDGDDLQALYDTLASLATEKDEVLQALSLIESEMQARRPVAYVSAGASPARETLEDYLLAEIFFAAGNARERARGRVSDVLTLARNLKLDTRKVFEGMPAELKGPATSYSDWEQRVRSGDLDDRIGKIEGWLGSDEAMVLARPKRSTAKTMAAESAPLVAADVSATAHGSAVGAYRAADLMALTKKWTEYARQFYGDGSSDPNQQTKDRDQLEEIIRQGLSGLAPGLSPDVLDSVSRQISGELVSAIPSLNNGASTSRASDEAWIEEIVQTVADKLLEDGESGIDTAVVTDDLRQCLTDTLATAMSRQDALSICQSAENSPTTWIDEAVYYAQKQLEAAGVASDDAFDQSLAYGNCLRNTWWNFGATKDQARAECEGFLDISPPPAEPTSAPTPAPTAAPTPTCPPDEDGDTVVDMDALTEDCFGTPLPVRATPTPVKTPCADFDPLCGLSQ